MKTLLRILVLSVVVEKIFATPGIGPTVTACACNQPQRHSRRVAARSRGSHVFEADLAAVSARAIDAACDRIAPTWPLDQFIAVNPYWGWRTSPMPDAAAHLGVLAGTALTMPRSWFREEFTAGRLDARHLEAAAIASGEADIGPGIEAAAADAAAKSKDLRQQQDRLRVFQIAFSRRGKPDAGSRIHRLGHVGDDLAHALVDLGNRFGDGVQTFVGVMQDGQ